MIKLKSQIIESYSLTEEQFDLLTTSLSESDRELLDLNESATTSEEVEKALSLKSGELFDRLTEIENVIARELARSRHFEYSGSKFELLSEGDQYLEQAEELDLSEEAIKSCFAAGVETVEGLHDFYINHDRSFDGLNITLDDQIEILEYFEAIGYEEIAEEQPIYYQRHFDEIEQSLDLTVETLENELGLVKKVYSIDRDESARLSIIYSYEEEQYTVEASTIDLVDSIEVTMNAKFSANDVSDVIKVIKKSFF